MGNQFAGSSDMRSTEEFSFGQFFNNPVVSDHHYLINNLGFAKRAMILVPNTINRRKSDEEKYKEMWGNKGQTHGDPTIFLYSTPGGTTAGTKSQGA